MKTYLNGWKRPSRKQTRCWWRNFGERKWHIFSPLSFGLVHETIWTSMIDTNHRNMESPPPRTPPHKNTETRQELWGFYSGKVLLCCDTMGEIRFCGCGCGCKSEDPFVCFGRKPTQRACARDFPRDRKRTRKERSEREQKKLVGRTGQSTEESSQEKRAGAGACGLRGRVGQSERISERFWWLCGNFSRIYACNISYNARKESQTSPFLRLGLTLARVCLFSFLHPLGCVCCVLCVRKEVWNTPDRRWEKPLDDLMGMCGLGGSDSGDRPALTLLQCSTTLW